MILQGGQSELSLVKVAALSDPEQTTTFDRRDNTNRDLNVDRNSDLESQPNFERQSPTMQIQLEEHASETDRNIFHGRYRQSITDGVLSTGPLVSERESRK